MGRYFDPAKYGNLGMPVDDPSSRAQGASALKTGIAAIR
jgi:hypothetical protein